MKEGAVAYVKPFTTKRYFRFTAQAFGILLVAFTLFSFMQSRVMYSTAMTMMVGEPLTGCSLEQSGTPLSTTCGYFLHNSSVAIIAWLGGFVLIGPFWILWENAANIGAYIAHAISHGAQWGDRGAAFAFLIPHGIFEIPALLLSVAMGIYIANSIVEDRGVIVDYDIWEAFLKTLPWALIVFGLLGIAAFIEANISEHFALWVGGWF